MMTPEGRQLLIDILHRHREEVVDQATDWVIAAALDLQGRRPRGETRALVARVVSGNEAALLQDNTGPLLELVDYVTSLRATHEFHPSTLLRGFVSFRHALEGFLRAEANDGWTALDVLTATDEVYSTVACRLADLYAIKLNATVEVRRRELEEELHRVTVAKERELEEKIATINAQRRDLAELSSPVIRVWEGILVAPLVGELGADRAALVRQRVLDAIAESGADAVLLDITGLTVVDARVAVDLLRLTEAARLLGAEGMLVGVSGAVARALVELEVDIGAARTFSSLQDGLRAALRLRTARPRE